MLHEISSIPGVERVGIVDYLPLERNRSWDSPRIKGKHYEPGELAGRIRIHDHARLSGCDGHALAWTRLHLGRRPKSEPVVILNQSAAH
jgi:hypothetical protein